MNEYDNGEISPISATVQAFWEEQNECLDSDYEEARQEYIANYPELEEQ